MCKLSRQRLRRWMKCNRVHLYGLLKTWIIAFEAGGEVCVFELFRVENARSKNLKAMLRNSRQGKKVGELFRKVLKRKRGNLHRSWMSLWRVDCNCNSCEWSESICCKGVARELIEDRFILQHIRWILTFWLPSLPVFMVMTGGTSVRPCNYNISCKLKS